ncbi:MAG TPA: hypothetical protein VN397_03190 [Candidatus Methylomirabilis sp.]|nr:hypothetical protein [Candidatus Methylomirabilis sp.]
MKPIRAARESKVTVTDALHVFIPLTCGIAVMIALRLLVHKSSAGAEFIIGMSVMHAIFVDLVYFEDINRFEAERPEKRDPFF